MPGLARRLEGALAPTAIMPGDHVLAGAGDVDRLNADAMLDYDLHAAGFLVQTGPPNAAAGPDNDGVRPFLGGFPSISSSAP